MNFITEHLTKAKTLTTSNRRLENFLHSIGIDCTDMYANWDGLTVWVYDDTPELRKATEVFFALRDMSDRRRSAAEGGSNE